MPSKRLLIVDDHPLFREGLKAILRRDPSFAVAGEAGSYAEALRTAKACRPDVALLDISLPDRSGIQLARELRQMLPGLGILMVSMHAKVDYVAEALKVGALGYLTKDAATDNLLSGLRAVAAGQPWLDPTLSVEISRSLLARTPRADEASHSAYDSLTPREREVMRLVVEGLSNKEVAGALEISVKTAEHHRGSLMRKLGMQNSVELVRYATKLGLID
ncbi:response regulator [Solidesulfovibrio carbinolicus]|uniref:DNA-binding response regulator n=1 Tax=Solidesulfovibrio carbinolicus TaxID=296842 RepID=A0A4P6HNE7_9BACT|nr:response regulator transcription factor [Solidesulfovibrio carbinolicus]QAZ68164.1 DNA-binding response regulator [Solidesulfovibrio carbinolicus]